jgi:hypothetical protein
VSAEQLLDRALLLVPLPTRHGALDDYAHDMDDTAGVRAAKAVAVRMAKFGDEESCHIALFEAARLTIGF